MTECDYSKLKTLLSYLHLFRGHFTRRQTAAFEQAIENLFIKHKDSKPSHQAALHRLNQLTQAWCAGIEKIGQGLKDPLVAEVLAYVHRLTKKHRSK